MALVFYWCALFGILQDSFVSNLLRLIHTMRPPKKKKKKATKKESSTSSQALDPVVEAKRQRFPGLSLPDDTERVQSLLKPKEGEQMKEEDAKVASEALDEVNAEIV